MFKFFVITLFFIINVVYSKSLIVGGEKANPKNYPWFVSLAYENPNVVCGGSILNKNFILTAAHCLTARGIGKVTGIMGGGTSASPKKIGEVDQFFIHPNYDSLKPGSPYDLAIIKLKSDLIFNSEISFVHLLKSSADLIFNETLVTLIGRGSNNTEEKNVLKYLELILLPPLSEESFWFPKDSQLKKFPSKYDELLKEVKMSHGNSVLVVGDFEGKSGACRGDSGGPLVIYKNNKVYQVGIAANNLGPCPTLTLFTSISNYYDWIMKMIR